MALPDNPLTRGEQYLNRIATGRGTIPDEPLTRVEQYLDYIAKNGGASEPLEEIRTYTCDGSETSSFYLDADNDGNPYRLKRAVVITTLGEPSANGTYSFNLQCADKIVGQGYQTFTTSAANNKMVVLLVQDGGFWHDVQTGFTNSIGALSLNTAYSFSAKVEDYPHIDKFRLTRAVPAGTVIKILGVRA